MDTPRELNSNDPVNLPVNPTDVETVPAEAPVESSGYANPDSMIVIPRVLVNYIIVAVTFFALGAVISGAASSVIFNANSTENRSLIDTAVSAAMDARGTAAQTAGQTQPVPGQRYTVSTDDDPTIGDANAPITIVEFSDFHCQYCGRFFNETLTPILTDYAGKVRLVNRDYPILGAASVQAALAAGCANDQGNYWDFHDMLFENQQNLTRDAFLSYAQELKFDMTKFTTCLDSQAHMDEITKDYTDAQNLGISGTPAFFINGRFISGAQPYTVFASAINEELAGAAESTPDPSSSS